MNKDLLDEFFPVPNFPKPRQVRQTWLKETGVSRGRWSDKMGLRGLADYLEVMAPRVDYVKVVPNHVINSSHEWFMRKVSTYMEYSVAPYFDHAFFKQIHSQGKIEQGIAAAAELGMPAMEFMNVYPTISARRWTELVKLATANNVNVIYEFHPPHTVDKNQPKKPATSEEILRAAMPCLEAGATFVMFDHKEFDMHGERAAEAMEKLVDELGHARLVFEVDSSTWSEHLRRYFRLFGSEINVSNIFPSQVMEVEKLRQASVL